MRKQPISVTIEPGNLLWLKSRTVAMKRRSVSETIDALIADARQAGSASGLEPRSVVGTVDISGDDPALNKAKDFVRDMVDLSLSRPVLVREEMSPYGRAPKRKRRRG